MAEQLQGRVFIGTNASVLQIHKQVEHLSGIKLDGPSFEGSDSSPTPDQLASFLETAFWASLKTDEGRSTRFSATLAAREDVMGATVLTSSLAYDETQIAKIAPALGSRGCLGVSVSDGGFSIWGFARGCPGSWVNSVTVRVSEPGVLRVNVGPFQPFAVLDGRSDAVIASTNISLAFALESALGKPLPTEDLLETQAVWRERVAITDVARAILDDGHGGDSARATRQQRSRRATGEVVGNGLAGGSQECWLRAERIDANPADGQSRTSDRVPGRGRRSGGHYEGHARVGMWRKDRDWQQRHINRGYRQAAFWQSRACVGPS
jgi:hypothetical protein